MSYLVNDKNIAPIAYGKCENGTGKNLYNCSVTGTNPYTVTLTTGSYTNMVPVATARNGDTHVIATVITTTTATFQTHYTTTGNGVANPFNFVLFGYN
jgi:hypothetical protein